MKIEKSEMPKDITTRHNLVNKRLKKLWNEDDEFKYKFQGVYDYYKNKLSKELGTRVNHDDFSDGYFTYVTDLFYQGYYLGRELLEHEEVIMAKRFFEQPNGIIKEQTFDILKGAAGDLVQILSHEESADFETSLIQENEYVRNILLQIKTDIASLGAYQSFIDERETKGINVYPEAEDAFKGLLYRADDLFFVDPQKYFICLLADNHSEVWELNLWSTVSSRNRKVGEAHLSVFEAETTNKMVEKLPYYQGFEALKRNQKSVSVALSLSEKLDEKEQLNVLANIVESLRERLQVDYKDINVTLSVTEEVSTYKYDPTTIEGAE